MRQQKSSHPITATALLLAKQIDSLNKPDAREDSAMIRVVIASVRKVNFCASDFLQGVTPAAQRRRAVADDDDESDQVQPDDD